MVKIISFFNHKGGVSKTTTTFNIGCKLAKTKRVLLVDGDPQANLTGLMCGFNNWEPDDDEQEMESFIQQLERKYDDFFKQYRTLYSYLDDFVNARSLGLDDVIANSNLFEFRENLFLLPGSIQTSELQPKITAAVNFAFSQNLGMEVYRKTPGAFRKLLLELAKTYNIDYILVDLSPDLGLLNQSFLFNSDYFVIPSTPDYFSIQAIKSIAKFLPSYYDNFRTFRNSPNLNGFTMPAQPKFLGYIVQRFTLQSGKVQSEQEKKEFIPTKRFQAWIKRVHNCVDQVLLPKLIAESMTLPNGRVPLHIDIPEFHSFVADLQRERVPVFELSPEKISSLNLSNERNATTAKNKLKKLDQLFDQINEIFINL
jgi:chromosome partitioning protein